MYYQVKKSKSYSWPCALEPERKIEIFTDDILQKDEVGKYTKLTGLCCCNIHIPDKDVKEIKKEINLIW